MRHNIFGWVHTGLLSQSKDMLVIGLNVTINVAFSLCISPVMNWQRCLGCTPPLAQCQGSSDPNKQKQFTSLWGKRK